MFSDWLEEQTTVAAVASTAKLAAAPAYAEADFEYGCFAATQTDNCRCVGCTDYCYCEDCSSPPCCKTSYLE
jgi:hypothetical protein